MSMNVGTSTDSYNNYQTQAGTSVNTGKENAAAEKSEDKKTSSAGQETAAVYEKSSETEQKATYKISKMSSGDRAALVQKMKQEFNNRKSQMADLVQKMLSNQAGKSNLAGMFSPDMLKKVSAADIAQAKEDISEDGYWGVKQTSQRLFDFACALAGDDVEKMKKMEAAMEKGFKKAEKAWGGELPGICKDTIAASRQLFDDYYASKGVEKE